MKAVRNRVTVARLLGVLILGLLLSVLAALGARAQQGDQAVPEEAILLDGIIYVDGDATGANDGTSWDDAFTGLQDALDAAVSGDEIWVAEGTYLPTVEHGGSGDRYWSFQLMNGVALYGGFDPSAGDVAWEDRDWVNNVTIASGDIGVDGDPADNAYHVFYHPSGTDLDGTAILDGFTVTGGNANDYYPHDHGGGMHNDHSSPTVANCTFQGNSATSGAGMSNRSSSSPTLTGCAFENNTASGGMNPGYGGGMYNASDSSPTLTGCTFSGNSAGGGMGMSGTGGGMHNNHSSPTLTDCTFAGNSANFGGGMYNASDSSPILTGCTFSGNSTTSGAGGGMYNWQSSPTLTDCTFSGNTVSSSPAEGGGMYNDNSSPTLTQCTFEGNSAQSGGGMYNEQSSPTLTDCTFNANSASHRGGGLYNDSSSPTLANCIFDGNVASGYSSGWGGGIYNGSSSPLLTNSVFDGNSAALEGGGIYNGFSSPTLTNCTFSGNDAGQGGGIYNYQNSSPVLTNCVLWGDTPDEVYSSPGSSPAVTHSDVQGGYTGEGNIDADPLFVDAGTGDLHLQGCSPAIDAGDNAAPDLPSHDFEGDDRIIYGNVDMGVDEVDLPPPASYDLAAASTAGGSVTEPGEGSFTYRCGRIVSLLATPDTGYRFLHWTGDPVADPSSSSTTLTMDDNHSVAAEFVSGAVVHVDADAAGANDGTSWSDAYIDLQSGLDAATPGIEIWVAAGTYRPSEARGGTGDRYKSFQLMNGVALYGGFDPSAGDVAWEDRDWENNVTIASGDIGVGGDPADNAYHVFYHPSGTDLDSTAILDGFTVTGGKANGGGDHSNGGGMYNQASSPALANCTFSASSASSGGGMTNISSSPALTNCTFDGNSATSGGGMYNESSSPALTNCTFKGNSVSGFMGGGDGGGMYNDGSSPTLNDCTFETNSAGSAGGAIYNYDASSPSLTNCSFDRNSSYRGGGMANYGSSSPSLTNCTFSDNSASSGGGMYNDESSPVLTNCILWGDSPEAIFDDDSTPLVSYSDIQGGYPGEHNIDADPLLVDPASGDLHLQACSPAIDSGDNAATDLPAHDFDGDDRIINGTVDMGIDEVDFPPPTTYVLTAASTVGGSVTEPGEGAFPYSCGRIVSLVATPDADYRFANWTGDPVDDPDSPSTTIAMTRNVTVTANFIAGFVFHVDVDATGANDGTSWDDAFIDLQDGLDAALPEDKIWVAEGTYLPSVEHGGSGERFKSFQLMNHVSLYGGFDPSVGDVAWEDRDWGNNATIASGDVGVGGDTSDNTYHVFYHPSGTGLDGSAILDGFTVTGGNANGSGDHNSGGGMHNNASSPAVANCIFEGNSAQYPGGGMYNRESSPVLTNVTFSANSANSGGGMYNSSSSPVLRNCTFSGNWASGGGESSGGGLYNYDSTPSLTNCTFEGNGAAERGGAIYNYNSSPTLVNSILWADTPDEIYDHPGSSPSVTHSDIQGGFPGEGNIDADPKFVDAGNGDYHLQACSPASDSGDNGAPNLPPYDFEGDDRIVNGTVDMGVDEVDYPPPASYDLSVGSTAGGSVTEPGEGTFTYGCGRAVSLVAASEPGYRFLRWTGDPVADPGSSSTTVTMDGDRSITAEFISGAVIYVDVDAVGADDGTSWVDAYPDLQSGLDAATPGVEIWVAAGTYKPSRKLGGHGTWHKSFQLINGVALYGGFDPSGGDVAWEDRDWSGNVTSASCDIGIEGDPFDNCYHVFYHPHGIGLDSTAILDGFTVTDAVGSYGGGMYNSSSSPVLRNCTFSGNSGSRGAGMYNWNASPTLTNCTFSGNSGGSGLGMYNVESSPSLTNCTFSSNLTGMYGGGMYNSDSSPILTNCTFQGNSAEEGGAMYNAGASPVLINCTFHANSSDWSGGGIYNSRSSPALTNCIFLENEAGWRGGGVYNWYAEPTLTNCTFYDNSAGDYGAGMYSDGNSPPVVTNCILWGTDYGQLVGYSLVTYSDVEGGTFPGEGNIEADPLFVDAENGDFHLRAGSPCIDAGSNDAPNLPSHDFEGDDRIVDGNRDGTATVDMGVDEVVRQHVYLPLLTRNAP